MTKAEFKEPLPVVRLWVHECERVLSDRLVSDNDLAKFSEMRVDVIKKHFGNMPLVSIPRVTDSFGSAPEICSLNISMNRT